jgi:sucrose-6-phosphate hydrolase SacC (GH32 family)
MYLDFTGLETASRFTIAIGTGEEEETLVGYSKGNLFVDRTRSGNVDFHKAFAARHEAPVRLVDGKLSIRLFLDTSSLEIFAADGEVSLTHLIFPKQGPRHISIRDGRGASLKTMVIQPLKSVEN